MNREHIEEVRARIERRKAIYTRQALPEEWGEEALERVPVDNVLYLLPGEVASEYGLSKRVVGQALRGGQLKFILTRTPRFRRQLDTTTRVIHPRDAEVFAAKVKDLGETAALSS